jgi:hypothetical protein
MALLIKSVFLKNVDKLQQIPTLGRFFAFFVWGSALHILHAILAHSNFDGAT